MILVNVGKKIYPFNSKKIVIKLEPRHHTLRTFNPRNHMTLIKKNVFCFPHGICNFDFLSFCKFPLEQFGDRKIFKKI